MNKKAQSGVTAKAPLSTDHRDNHSELSHSMVHYLLTIHSLKEIKGYARVTDVARSLNLTKGSVSIAINNLKKKGLLVEEEHSKFIYLSDKGHSQVHGILSARTLLFYFLKDILQVEEEVAVNDSCLMEHLLSRKTREKFFEFMKNYSVVGGQPAAGTASESSKGKKAKTGTFQTMLNLTEFKSLIEFEDSQKPHYEFTQEM
jgi:DtxR family Mn-dependent transcriptional regulator